MKPRLAFVDHSFHKKTRSGDFLRELFATEYQVIDVWDDSWKRDGAPFPVDDINRGGFSRVFFFQTLPDIEVLRRIGTPMVWAPMYDSVVQWDRKGDFWLALMDLPMKILCFCRTLYDILHGRGLECLYVQYFMDPAQFVPVMDYRSHRLFFWQRRRLTFTQVKKIIGENPIAQCIVKLDPDPGFLAMRPSPQDVERYKVTRIVSGDIERNDYLGLLQQSNIFIAPRTYEGIGMSFLEAMAMGMVVVGMNQPTLNEYVRHGENGWLLENGESPVEFADIERLGRRARQDCEQGFLVWQTRKQAIVSYLLEDAS